MATSDDGQEMVRDSPGGPFGQVVFDEAPAAGAVGPTRLVFPAPTQTGVLEVSANE